VERAGDVQPNRSPPSLLGRRHRCEERLLLPGNHHLRRAVHVRHAHLRSSLTTDRLYPIEREFDDRRHSAGDGLHQTSALDHHGKRLLRMQDTGAHQGSVLPQAVTSDDCGNNPAFAQPSLLDEAVDEYRWLSDLRSSQAILIALLDPILQPEPGLHRLVEQTSPQSRGRGEYSRNRSLAGEDERQSMLSPHR